MSRFVGDMHDFVDLAGTVVRDVGCHRCGQRLRGLNQKQKCPRCGTPVEMSVCGDYLRFSDHRWLGTVARGIRLTIGGILLAFGLSMLAALVLDNDPVVRQFLTFIGTSVGFWGAWLMTEPEPGRRRRDGQLDRRTITRTAVTLGFVASVVQLLTSASRYSQQRSVELVLVGGACGVILIAAELAKLHYLEQLAARLPEPTLVWRAAGLKWAIGGLTVLLLIGVALYTLAVMSMVPSAGPNCSNLGDALAGTAVVTFLIVPVAIVLVIICYMIVDLLHRMSVALAEQARLARGIWQHGLDGSLAGTVGAIAAPRQAVQWDTATPPASAPNLAETSPAVVPLKVAHLVDETALARQQTQTPGQG